MKTAIKPFEFDKSEHLDLYDRIDWSEEDNEPEDNTEEP